MVVAGAVAMSARIRFAFVSLLIDARFLITHAFLVAHRHVGHAVRMSWFLRPTCGAAILGVLALSAVVGRAQNSMAWTTNYYTVTGANFREIRQSMANSRPWKNDFAGKTRWTVEWKFNLTQIGNQCTTTKIVTTLPRWTPAADATPETKERWTRFSIGLAQHEAGHARIGMTAAAEVGKAIAGVGAQTDCDRLKQWINGAAERVMDDYRRREQEYDRVTNHGRGPVGAR